MAMRINGETKLTGIIGYPLKHTLSPRMHNEAFKALNLNYLYLPLEVAEDSLPQAISGLKAFNFRGINVTIPYKEKVFPFLDEVATEAKTIGAVNTIVHDRGRLIGYNTDAPGFLLSLKENGVEVTGKKVLLLGAGGAARAVAYALLTAGAELVIANRTIDKAKELAKDFRGVGKISEILELGEKPLSLEPYHMVVNTLPLGMHPYENQMPAVDFTGVTSDFVAYDLIYNPAETKFLKASKEKGARTINGLSMLLWQGVLAFEKWTGVSPPVEVMKKAIGLSC
ncbi:shikimate dehydrogenase [Carboxydothermus islandicus]|uniref:Shikimate dehydrogenase (NADP(+)) n=1 Tax=Carboxydothermus islandicus TaxID=661089 RepID=A0A1L8CZU4_9THEO|nr:shikimate dehydrogenase [Carboxydothermus islandicus]GAV24381.1 shikimate dehydrogenase [Carboxydothermus islandicus]